MNPDGTGVVQVTKSADTGIDVDWQPTVDRTLTLVSGAGWSTYTEDPSVHRTKQSALGAPSTSVSTRSRRRTALPMRRS
jgi:hypothetical protein